MSDPAHRIVALCGALSTYADRQAALSGDGTALFDAVDPLYREFEAVMSEVSPPAAERLLTDPALRATEGALHRLRAAYEFDKEGARARDILESREPSVRLAAYMRQEAHWALGPELRDALRDCRDVLVAGSGALPLTAIAIAAELPTKVTALERDADAFALGMRLIETAGFGGKIGGIRIDILALEDLSRYDAVVGAVLLGVERHGDPRRSKAEIVEGLLARLRPGARLILREPHGLGRLLYPPAGLGARDDIAVTRHHPSVGRDVPYRSGVIVARRLEPEACHAEPSALPVHP